MTSADAKKQACVPDDAEAVTKGDLQEVRKELRATSEKLKTLEVRVGALEQNLLGN